MQEATTYAWLVLVVVGAVWLNRRLPGSIVGLGLSVYVLSQFAVTGSSLLGRNPAIVKGAVMLVVLAALSIRCLRTMRIPLSGSQALPYGLCLAIYGYAALSTTWAVDPDESWTQLLTNLPYVLGLTLAGPLLIRGENDLKGLITTFLAISGSTLLLILLFREWGYRGLALPVAKSDTGTWTDFESTPLELGTAAGLVFLFAGGLLEKKSGATRLLALSLMVMSVLLMLRTGLRGQLVSATASLVLYLFLRHPRGSGLVLPIIFLVATIVLLPVILISLTPLEFDLIERFGADELSRGVDERLALQGALFFRYFSGDLSTWLFGLGSSSSYTLLGIYPHNVAVEVLCELGFVGAFLVGALLFSTARRWIRRRSISESAAETTLLAAGTFYLLLVSQKQSSFLGAAMLMMFVMVLSRVTSSRLVNRKNNA